MSGDISKPFTRRTKEDIKNYEENYNRIFGQPDNQIEKLTKELHNINDQRHKIINGIQSKNGRTNNREWELDSLKKKRKKIMRELDRLK